MERECGNREFPIWLIGDSEPKHWAEKLDHPLDPKHPARHSIWTPILDGIQERVFRCCRSRVDVSELYIRNAVKGPSDKPKPGSKNWDESTVLRESLKELTTILETYNPPLVLSFGAFAFEFVRRSLNEAEQKPHKCWSAKALGEEFGNRACDFSPDTTNLLPLLHVSIARGKFLEAHKYFTGQEEKNYFEHVAPVIADILVKHGERFPLSRIHRKAGIRALGGRIIGLGGPMSGIIGWKTGQ